MTKNVQNETIRVSVRIRPLSAAERATFPGPSPVQAVGNEVRIFNPRHAGGDGSGRSSPASGRPSPRESLLSGAFRRPGTPTTLARQQAALITQQNDYQAYEFASVLPGDASEDHVYDASGCRDIVDSVCQGCNGTIFVYGQTGAGKTHTIEQMTQRVLQQLHARAAADEGREYAMFVSVIELYNEVLRDLVSGKTDLQLRNPTGGAIVVDGLVEKACTTPADTAALVAQAKAARVVAETRANAHSSRSHLILRVKVEAIDLDVNPVSSLSAQQHGGERNVTFSMLNLVDLAGSERVDKSGSADTAGRLREALNINKSLLCLGNVVTALAQRSDGRTGRTHVPYRDSKLTRLLEDSLGGSARTALIACVTPLPDWNLEQTRATLDFAARAGRIVCKPHANVVSLGSSGGSEVEALQKEVAQLRQLLAAQQQEAEALRRGVQKPLPPLVEVPDGDRDEGGAAMASPPSPSLSARLSDADVGCLSPPSRLPSVKEREGRTSLLWRLLHHRDRASSKHGADAAIAMAPEDSPRDDRRDALHSSASSVNADLEAAGEEGDSTQSTKHSSTGKKRTLSARRLLQSLSLGSRRSSAHNDGGSSGNGDGSSGVGTADAPPAAVGKAPSLDVSSDALPAQSPPATPGGADDASTPRAAGLRDHIIKQLVELLRHKKMEVKALKEAAAEQRAAMEALHSERGLQEAKLRDLVEGISKLSTTRQAEFAQWQQHLAQLEDSLLCAQQEAATYRSEAQALQVALTELQAQHASQEQQLRRASARALEAGRALSEVKHKQGTALQACLDSLISIQERLQAVEASASAQKRATGGQDHQLLDQVRALKHLLPALQDALAKGSVPAAGEAVPQPQESAQNTQPQPSSCRRCEATKGFLVLMQKLKDEVVVLTATVKARDTQLQGSQEANIKLKADLADARQQVQGLQERIDDLAAELEMERSATTAEISRSHYVLRIVIALAGIDPRAVPLASALNAAGVRKSADLISDDWTLSQLHMQIMQSWYSLALPLHHRSSFVLGTGQADPPWQSKAECQAHVAMLACLHQFYEDYPGKQQQQIALVNEEAALLTDSLCRFPKRELASMCEHWAIDAGDVRTKCRQLVERLWEPVNSSTPVSQQAVQGAILCRKALQLAPPDKVADVTLRLTAHMWSSAGMVLQEAAMP